MLTAGPSAWHDGEEADHQLADACSNLNPPFGSGFPTRRPLGRRHLIRGLWPSYKINADLMVYERYSTGKKAGGFSASATTLTQLSALRTGGRPRPWRAGSSLEWLTHRLRVERDGLSATSTTTCRSARSVRCRRQRPAELRRQRRLRKGGGRRGARHRTADPRTAAERHGGLPACPLHQLRLGAELQLPGSRLQRPDRRDRLAADHAGPLGLEFTLLPGPPASAEVDRQAGGLVQRRSGRLGCADAAPGLVVRGRALHQPDQRAPGLPGRVRTRSSTST